MSRDDQKYENIYALGIEVLNPDDRERIHKAIVDLIANGQNKYDLNVCLPKEKDNILVYSQRKGEQLAPEARGNILAFLRQRFPHKFTTKSFHGASAQEIPEVRGTTTTSDKTLSDLETKLKAAEKDVKEYMEMADDAINDKISRGDVHTAAACLVSRDNQLAKLRDLDQKYTAARSAMGDTIRDSDLVYLLKSSRIPVKETPEYKETAPRLKQVKELLEGIKGMKGLNLVSRQLNELEKKFKEAEAREAETATLRTSVKGHSIKYVVYIDNSGQNKTVNLMMPIDEKEKGTLADELINHIAARFDLLSKKEMIEQNTEYKRGLTTFSLTTKDKDVERVYKALLQDVFDSQQHYVFGAAGLRIDLETISSTSNVEIGTISYEGKAAESMYDGSERVMRENLRKILPGLPGDVFTNNRGTTKLASLATMLILADSGTPLMPVEVRRALSQYLPEYDPDTKANEVAQPNLMKKLAELGFLERIGSGRTAPYAIAQKYKPKSTNPSQ